MRRLEFVGARRLEFREVSEPRIESDDQVIVRPVASTTCDLDRAIIAGADAIGLLGAGGHCHSVGIYFEPTTGLPLGSMFMNGISFSTGRPSVSPVLGEVLAAVAGRAAGRPGMFGAAKTSLRPVTSDGRRVLVRW